MEFIKINDKNVKLNYIKAILFASIIILAIVSIRIFYSINSEGYGMNFNLFIRRINIILIFMAIIGCLLYYNNTKREEMFIAAIIYTILAVDIIGGNVDNISSALWLTNAKTSIVLINSILRLVLTILIISPLKSLKKLIIKTKNITVTIVLIVAICANILESNSIIFGSFKNTDFLIKYYFTTFFIYILFIGGAIIKSIKESETVYITIISSAFCICIRYLYIFIALSNPKSNFMFNIISTTVLGLIMVSFGVFLEFKFTLYKAKHLEKQIMLFYKIIDNNEYNDVLICNDKLEVIYCNKNIREYFDVIKNNEEIYMILTKILREKINSINKDLALEITKSVQNYGSWSGILKIHEEFEILRCSIQVIYTEENAKKYVFTYNDITKEFNTKRKLYESGEKFESLTNNIKDLIVITDTNGIIKYVNKALTQLLEYSYNEIIGQNIKEYTEEYVDYNYEGNNNNDRVIKYVAKSKNNKIIKLETIKSPILDQEGEIIEWVWVARDMEYIEAFNKLELKYKEIQEYQNIRNEYFANISHELRTPINIIYSSIQLLNSQFEKDNKLFVEYYRKYDNVLKQNCFRTLRLINNLIDITKVEVGHMELELVNKNIIKLVEDITLSLVTYVESKKINIIFDTNVEELEIQCDEEKIERVMLNLLSNAIKYTSENGEIFVNIMANDTWVEIRVKDDGIGIPDEMKDVIFERFVQVNKSLNRLKEGSGIGLALVKSIVELHKGKVFLDKECKVGSEFVVLLPNKRKESESNEEVLLIEKTIEEKIGIELSDIYDI